MGVCNASPSDGRFVTYSKEGVVAFWDTKMSLLKSYHVSCINFDLKVSAPPGLELRSLTHL